MTVTVSAIEEFNPSILQEMLDVDTDGFGEINQTIYSMETYMRFGKVFLLHKDSVLIGVAELIKDWHDPNAVYLVGISIHMKDQGKRYGTHFMREIIRSLREDGVRRIELHVDPANQQAVHLYKETFGFREVEYRKDEYGSGKDRVLLRLELS